MFPPAEGEAYDPELSGRRVRLKDGRADYVFGQACSRYNSYAIRLDGADEDVAVSSLDFDVIDEPDTPGYPSP